MVPSTRPRNCRSDNEKKLADEDMKTFNEAIDAAKKVAGDEKAIKESVETALKELNDKIMPIGAKMYEAAKDAPDDKSTSADSDSGTDTKKDEGDAVEGEVVDDKKS